MLLCLAVDMAIDEAIYICTMFALHGQKANKIIVYSRLCTQCFGDWKLFGKTGIEMLLQFQRESDIQY